MEKLYKKIVLIHTDPKFIELEFEKETFPTDKFYKSIIFFGNGPKKEFNSMNNFYHLKHNITGIQKALAICSSADLVIVYNLDLLKSIIVNNLNENVIVLWRFFGEELYSKIPNIVYSASSRKFAKKENKFSLKAFNNRLKQNLKVLLKYRRIRGREIEKAFHRVNYFFGLSRKEYDFLLGNFPNLPPFLQIPFSKMDIDQICTGEKELNLIVGNNRSKYNNHLDVLDLIKQNQVHPKIKFTLIFSYGPLGDYTRKVEKEAENIPNLNIIHNFLPREEFINLYQNASGLIINGYRQMAMGNIFYALQSKTKVYLNEINPIFHWLQEEGFKIYNIQQFEDDISTGEIILTEEEGAKNQNEYYRLCEKYSVENFHKDLLSIKR